MTGRRHTDHPLTLYGVTKPGARVLHVASRRNRDIAICSKKIVIIYRMGVLEAKEADHRPLCESCQKLGGEWIRKEWDEAPVEQPLIPRNIDEQIPAVRDKIAEWRKRLLDGGLSEVNGEVADEMRRVIKDLA